jgi:glycine/D-amino acid oxidase-like deaminating enzyme
VTSEGPDGCYWHVGRPPREPAPSLAGDTKADVAVIGAGYTGLAAAYHLRAADPSLDVVVLEAERAGYGASGRNAGFVMTLFGSSLDLMKLLHGKEKVRLAHHFMEKAIASLETMIAEHGIDCDYTRAGFLKVATAPAYVTRLRKEVEFFEQLGIEGIDWIEPDEVARRVRSPRFLGACWEPGCGSLNPLKWLDGLNRLAREAGATLYEGTPVTRVRREAGRFRLTTTRGSVVADKVVYATNAYTHLLPGMRLRQMPAFTYIIVTEPMTPAQRSEIGWEQREGIEDGRSFMHFFRALPDGRILVGGGPGFVPFGGSMNHDASPKTWDHLERFLTDTFPVLQGIKVTHRWGGAFSMSSNFTPQVGILHGGDVVYSLGCTGHGVAHTQMNGQIIRDLVLGLQTDLTEQWFVNQRILPIPPEPIRSIVARTVMATMALDDWWCDRSRK